MAADIGDILGAEAHSALTGSPLRVIDAAAVPRRLPSLGVLLAVDRAGALPALDHAAFDALVTVARDAPAPWVSVDPARLEASLAAFARQAAATPIATAVLARVLRMGETLAFDAALEIESLAYSTLLGGDEFARWLGAERRERGSVAASRPVRYERAGDRVTLTLDSPGNRNAMTATMRDAFYEALANVLDDPTAPSLLLRGDGRCFSVGGDLAEFGSARDLARAHLIRTQRSCTRLLHRLGDRAEVRVHGACIGSGIEVATAAARLVAAPDSFVQLPELRMGLMPGAGGTVSIARRIGRQRLLTLLLGAGRLKAVRAREWGLFDRIAA